MYFWDLKKPSFSKRKRRSKKKRQVSYVVVWSLSTVALLVAVNAIGLFLLETHVLEPAFINVSPREYLRANCKDPDCDFPTMDAIASCESGWRMVKNSSSSAFGYYQIIDGTEATTPQYKEGERKFDPYTNIDMGLYLYSTRGTNPWNESKGCWYYKRQAYSHRGPELCIGLGCEE